MAYLFRFYRLGFILKNDSKNFQEFPSSFEDFFKGLFLRCSVIKVPVVADLSQQLLYFITLSCVCQPLFYFLFSAVRFLRLPADSSYILANFISFVNTFFEVFLFFEEGNFSPMFFQISL